MTRAASSTWSVRTKRHPPPLETPFRWGYVLTEGGLQRGLAAEQPFLPGLLWRAGMVLRTGNIPDVTFTKIGTRLCDGRLTLQTLCTLGAAGPAQLGDSAPYHYQGRGARLPSCWAS